MHLPRVLLPLLANAVLLFNVASSCASTASRRDLELLAAYNNNARSNVPRKPHEKISIDNVRVFDGQKLLPPQSIVIDGGIIGTDSRHARHIDGKGATLIPGLIDAHCHPSNVTDLDALTKNGVTTAFVMSCPVPEMCASLKHHRGLAGVILGSDAASAPGSTHGNLTAPVDPALLIANESQVPGWIDTQVSHKIDFVKLVSETPGLSPAVLKALTQSAHGHEKKVAVHAVAFKDYETAVVAGADHIQHAPLDVKLPDGLVSGMHCNDQTSTPTLTMMRATAAIAPGRLSFQAAMDSVTALHKAGVKIFAGTDANSQPGIPAHVPFGTSLHDELDNLVQAGLSNLEALRAATILPVHAYGLHDRGSILPGMRADLVLIDGNPLEDIKTTRNIQRVWVEGIEYSRSA